MNWAKSRTHRGLILARIYDALSCRFSFCLFDDLYLSALVSCSNFWIASTMRGNVFVVIWDFYICCYRTRLKNTTPEQPHQFNLIVRRSTGNHSVNSVFVAPSTSAESAPFLSKTFSTKPPAQPFFQRAILWLHPSKRRTKNLLNSHATLSNAGQYSLRQLRS